MSGKGLPLRLEMVCQIFGGVVVCEDLEVRIEPLQRPHEACIIRGHANPLEAELRAMQHIV